MLSDVVRRTQAAIKRRALALVLTVAGLVGECSEDKTQQGKEGDDTRGAHANNFT